jgi:hypothetical protein
MSVSTAKAARAAMKDKAQRLARKPSKVKTQIDMGSMDAAQQGATAKTQKAYRTARKDGGKVHGKAAPKRADKVQRIKKQDAGPVTGRGLVPSGMSSDQADARRPGPRDALNALQFGAGTSPTEISGGTGAPFRGFPPIRGQTRDLVEVMPPRTGGLVPKAAAATAAQLANAALQREGASPDATSRSTPRVDLGSKPFSDFNPNIPTLERTAPDNAAPIARARRAAAAPATREPTADELMDYYNIKGGRVSNEMAQLAAMRNRPGNAGPMKRGGAAKKKTAKKTAKGR